MATDEKLNDEEKKTEELISQMDSATADLRRQIETMALERKETHLSWKTWAEECKLQREKHQVRDTLVIIHRPVVDV